MSVQGLRDRLQGTMAKVIMAIIVIPFAAFGIDAFFTGGVPEVAIVNDEEITEPELMQAIELQRRRIINQADGEVDSSLLDESVLRGPVLDQLIDRALLRQVAERGGLRVPRELVDNIILQDENFTGPDGQFSAALFENLLRSSGLTPLMYRNLLGEDLLLQQVTGGLLDSQFLTRAELEVAARVIQQQRDVRYLLLPAPADDAIGQPEEDDLQALYDADPQRWLSEERVDVQYLELRQDQMVQPIDEDSVRAEYERRLAGMQLQTERRAAHILLETGDGVDDDAARQRLLELKTRLDGGAAFDELAAEFSDDRWSAEQGGDLGFSAGDVFPPEFEQALATLEVGEVSGPVKTESGWHLIKLVEQSEAEPPAYETLRDEIALQLQLEAVEGLFVERVEVLADLTFNSEDLQDAADTLKLDIQTAEGVTRNAGEGLFADPRLRRTAFSTVVLEERLNSDTVELGRDHIVVLRVIEHHPPEPKPFASVRDQLAAEWRVGERRRLLERQAEELLARLDDGVRLDALAEEGGYEWQVVLGATRAAPGLPPAVQERAFAMNLPPDVDRAHDTVLLADGGMAIVELAGIKDGRLADIGSSMRQQLRNVILQTRAQGLAESFGRTLRDQADIEIL